MRLLGRSSDSKIASGARRALTCAGASLCLALTASAQEAVPVPGDSPPTAPVVDAGPLKVLSWNVATSPYAIAMRKIKMATPSWRTSFGAERRTINPPAAPTAADFDYDVVLLQGVINPRALRRLFPARKWRLILSTRALSSLPKGSVFTAPVSTTEVEAVALRYRQGLRIATRVDIGAPGGNEPASVGDPRTADAPGVAVKVLRQGETLWIGSASVGADCSSGPADCAEATQLTQWRLARRQAGEGVILGGQLGARGSACDMLSIEADVGAGARQTRVGAPRDLLGCAAEFTVP